MDALIRMHVEHHSRNVPPEVEAAWLHHRFSQIHPFADGNGRVARAIASLVFIKAGWFPLIVKREDKPRYIDALEKADDEDLRPLVSLFVEGQRNALVQATEVAYDIHPITTAHDAALAARDRLVQRGKLPMNNSREVAAALIEDAKQRLTEVANELTEETSGLGSGYEYSVVTGIQHDVAQFGDFDREVHLKLSTGTLSTLVLPFHAIGPRFRGLIAVVPYLVTEGIRHTLIGGMGFQINYEESLESATKRFSAWLDEVIVKGLNMWRRTL